MKYTSLKKQKLTKNILSIFFSLIMGVALSFGLFTSKTMAANENFTIDFIIATTDLRNASKYTNDTTLTEYVQDDNGNFIKWALNGEYYNIKTQLTKGERTIKSAISPKVDENNDGNGDIVYFAPLNAYYNADGTGITNLTNSFSNTNFDGTNVINSFVDGLELELGADVNYLYFRFNEAGELKPYGNIAKVIQLSDGTILADSERLVSTELTYTQNTFEVYLLNINETNQSYVEIDNKTNPLYAFTYLYGYDYTEFSNEKYGEIAGANDTIIFASLDSEKQLKSDSTTYNRYLMYPTLSEGEYVLFNGAWQEISYCNADGSQDAGFEGETNYALLYNQDGIKIWVELGTNIYYYSQDNMLEKLTLKTADNIEIKTYAYKLNRDLYIKSSNASGGFDYKTINETLGDSLKITGIGTEAFSISGIPYKYDERVCKSNYYYDIFKAVYDSNNKDIIGYQYYNQELRAQDNFKAGGESAFINTYFSDDILENLYYFGESGYTPVFKQVYDNNSKTGELSSTTSSSSKIILNNYSTQETLYNNTNTSINAQVENVYLSFGDIFDPIKNNSMTEITYGITVELKLYNTYYNGITIVTNEPVRQTEKNVSKDDTQVLKNNEFWFQYLDLRNLRYYTDQNRSANDVVEESAGKYVLNISYTTYNRDTKVDKSNLSFRYTFYVDELSNKLDYPTFNTETAFALNEIDAINYYYNFQNDVIPTITFDASEYGLNYTYNYGQYSLEYQSEFFTVSRPSRNDNTKRTYTVTDNSITGVNTTIDQNIRTVVETSVLDITQYTSTSTSPYQRHKIVANATIIDKPEIENSNISYIDGNNVTRNYDRLILLEYYYYLNDTNLNFGNIDYKNEPYGRFYKKIVQIIGFDKNSECYSYFTYTTEEETAEKTSWVSYEISKDYSGQIIYTTKIAPVNNFSLTSYYENLSGFKADKYQQLFTNEIIDFDYIITISFEELGQYYFELKYVTSTEPVSSNTTLGPAYNSPDYYSFKYPYIENTYINNSMPTIEPVLQDTKKKILNVLLDTNQHENVVFGEYKLDIFGVKSYFNEYDSKTNTSTTIDFRQVEEDIYSDVTSKVVGKEITYSDITAGCTLNGNTSIAKIPNTNRVPIKFDYYCNYIYDGSIPESKIYRYTSFTYNDDETCTINNLNKMEVSYFDKDTKPHLDGYYEVIIKYFYKDNDNELKEQYQVFAFVIDNSAPNVTYSTLKESIIDNDSKYSYWESMEHNTYTNSPVRATWRTANYFQYEVNPRLYKTNYSGITSLYGSNEYLNENGYDFKTGTESGNIYEINTGKYKFNLANNTIYSIVNGEIIATDKINQVKQNLLVYTYGNYNLSKTPLFNIIVTDPNFGIGSTDLEREYNSMLGNNFITISDFYNTNLTDLINKLFESGKEIEIISQGYQWELLIFPTSSYSNEKKFVANSNTTISSGALWGSGHYSLKLIYGSNSLSNITSGFTIDTLPIQGITTKAIIYNKNITSITYGFNSGSNTLINEPFTLIYEKKQSTAPIKSWYYTIPFKSSDYDSINLMMGSEVGVSVSELIEYLDSSTYTKKAYNFDHSYKNFGDKVPYSNVLEAPESALFIFFMEDSAGNTNNYYIIYDLTTPNYALGLSDKDANAETNYNKLYNIVTDTTELFWGNYKSIELTPSSLDLEYIYDKIGHINYTPTILERMLKNTVANQKEASKNNLKIQMFNRYWNIDDVWTEVTYVTQSEKEALISSLSGKEILKEGNEIVEKYYLNIPLMSAEFEYTATNSNDDFTKEYVFDLTKANAKNGTILFPSKAKLANFWNIDINSINTTTIENYGFYGENKYYYTISDILGNSSGDYVWMNLDMTFAFAFGLYENSEYHLDSDYAYSLNIRDIIPNSTASASQLYFSYNLDNTKANNLNTDFNYKFYPFDSFTKENSFYQNYNLVDITYNTSTEKYEMLFADKSNTDKTIKYEVSTKSTNNVNVDGEKVEEKLSSYPFALNYTGDSSKNGWMNLPTLKREYVYIQQQENNEELSDTSRIFTGLINQQSDNSSENLEDGIYTTPGLYVFRRVYTDYVNIKEYNNQGLAIVDTSKTFGFEDSIIRYYVYYIDRYSIIDVTSLIGSDISLVLGDYVNTATEINNEIVYNNDYSTILGYKEIGNNPIQNNVNYSNKSYTVSNSFRTSKGYVSLNLPQDKYNQPAIVDDFVNYYNSKNNNQEGAYSAFKQYLNVESVDLLSPAQISEKKSQLYTEFLKKYIFNINDSNWTNGIHYNSYFLLKLNMEIGASTNAVDIIESNDIESSKKEYLYESSINIGSLSDLSKSTTNYKSRLLLKNIYNKNLSSIIFNAINDNYSFTIEDNSGYDIKNNKKEANNSYVITIGLDSNIPQAKILVKDSNTTSYNTNKDTSKTYEYYLFENNGDLDNLKTIPAYATIENHVIRHENTNSQSLIFLIDHTTITNTSSATNPYNITITKTDEKGNTTTIFNTSVTFTLNGSTKVASFSYGSTVNTTEKMQLAFLDNSIITNGEPNKWAIVVYDNLAADGNYHNLLSNASDNATYNLIVSLMGNETDYDTTANTDYTTTFQITVDHSKPVYNLINIMESDIFINKNGISFETYNGYNYSGTSEDHDIDDYYEYMVQSGLAPLSIQYYLNIIYNKYLSYYKTTDLGDSYTTELVNQYGFTNSYFDNYYFVINEDSLSDAISLITNNNPEDTDTLYLRKISDVTNYKYSLTTDDYTSTTPSSLIEHAIFLESEAKIYTGAQNIDDGFYNITTNTINYSTVPQNGVSNNNIYDAYEIIEKDEAGNYRVYLVRLRNIQTRFIKDPKNPIIDDGDFVVASNLKIYLPDNSIKEDDFTKISLTYSFISVDKDGKNIVYDNTTNPIYIYNRLMEETVHTYYNKENIANPLDINTDILSEIKVGNQRQALLDILNNLIDSISQTFIEYALDFEFNIKMYDRFGGSKNLKFIIPGKNLELDIKYSDTSFTIKVPEDTKGRSTQIVGLTVYRPDEAQAGEWTPLKVDNNGKPFSDVNNGDPVKGTTSLGGQTYKLNYLQNNPYMIRTIDNFGRINNIYVNKPNSTQWNIGLTDVNYYHDEQYTSHDIVIDYQRVSYDVYIYRDISSDALGNNTDNVFNASTILNGNGNHVFKKYYYIQNGAVAGYVYEPNDGEDGYYILHTEKNGLTTLTIKQEKGFENKFIILIVDINNTDADARTKLLGNYYSFKADENNYNVVYYGCYDNNAINLYTKLPEIQLLNISGSIIARSNEMAGTTNTKVFIEPLNFRLYSSETYLFNPTASIYINGVLQANNVTTYSFKDDGLYTILVTNNLGYYIELEFEINTKDAISDYSVYLRNDKANKMTRLEKSDYTSAFYYIYNDNLFDTISNNSEISFTKPTGNNANSYLASRLYYYYAPSDYYEYYNNQNNALKIEIITNTNNQVQKQLIANNLSDPTKADDFGTYALYIIYDNTNNIIEFFIIQFVSSDNSTDYAKIKLNTTKSIVDSVGITKNSFSRDDDKLYIIFGSDANKTVNNVDKNYMKGNALTLHYYYNNMTTATLIKRISDLSKFTTTDNNGNNVTYYYLELTATGIHRFKIVDMAGNYSYYTTGASTYVDYFELYLVNSILYTINDKEPIPNYITNDTVTIKLLDSVNNYKLYTLSSDVTILKNGSIYQTVQTSNFEYKFTEAGTYNITVDAINDRNVSSKNIRHEIEFTIVNKNVAYNSYAISSAKGFTVVSIQKKIENVENAKVTTLNYYKGKNTVLIGCDEENSGTGYYTITLSRYLDSIKRNEEFTFNVWLNNRTDSTIIISSIPFGTSTTDIITLKYKPTNIYSNVGDCYITINDRVIETINKDSASETKTYSITEKGDYWIKIVSANGQILASYKLTKNEPLNTTAKIIIIIASIAVVALVIIFIVLRKKTKFR